MDETAETEVLVTTARLQQALTDQRRLVDEVAHLRTSNKRLGMILGLLLAILVGVAGLALWAQSAARTARDASRAVESLVERDQETRTQANLAACRVRNASNATTREQFTKQYDLFDSLVTSEQGRAFVAQLRATVPAASDQDRDCDLDGALGPGDYP